MRELLPDLEDWLAQGEAVALATVVSTWGSAPRPAGAFMAISESGKMAGSVSGGCVEGAVIDAALKGLKSGQAELLHFGVADESAWDVGLACGGKIDIFLQAVDQEAIGTLLEEVKAERAVRQISVISGPDEVLGKQVIMNSKGTLYTSAGLENLQKDIEKVAAVEGKAARVNFGPDGEMELFINPILPSPRLVIIGGVQIAIALSKIAKTLHFQSVIIDPRRAFLNTERFKESDHILHAWPDKAFEEITLNASSAVASLSHDPKIDDPALMAALKSDAFYIGALGSKKTQRKRLKRLEEKGLSEKELARIQGPIGLEIGALTPEEIALAIMGQVVEAYRN